MKAIFLIITIVLVGAPFLTTHVMAPPNNGTTIIQQQPTCTPPINGSCDIFNGKITYMFNNQTVCADGSHADNNGMCHYPICPDGSTPVGSGTCVGGGIGECVHVADENGNCQQLGYCGPSINGSCPDIAPTDIAPTNASLTLPPLRCDQSGYASCYNFGYDAGWIDAPGTNCPMIGYSNAGNATQSAHYCNGFKAGQIQGPIDVTKANNSVCPTHTPSCCVGNNGELIGNATDRRCVNGPL